MLPSRSSRRKNQRKPHVASTLATHRRALLGALAVALISVLLPSPLDGGYLSTSATAEASATPANMRSLPGAPAGRFAPAGGTTAAGNLLQRFATGAASDSDTSDATDPTTASDTGNGRPDPQVATSDPISSATRTAAATDDDHANAASSPGQTALARGVRIDRGTFGINVASWDWQMRDKSTVQAIRKLGGGWQQYPNSETFSWTMDRGRSPYPTFTQWNSFPAGLSLNGGPDADDPGWANVLRATNNQGLYIVNYGAAPDWSGGLTVADVQKITHYIVDNHLPIHAMVIGSELFGDWSLDLHPDRSPHFYAVLAKQMADAIHQIAPNMKVGVVLAQPDPTGPDHQQMHWAANNLAWNQAVLKIDTPSVDFFSVHDYLAVKNVWKDGELLRMLARKIPIVMGMIHQQIEQYAGPAGNNVEVWLTEYNPYVSDFASEVTKPASGSALVESYLLWRAEGMQKIFWWSLDGESHANQQGGWGAFALVANGKGPEPAENQFFETGKAYSRLTAAVGNGAQLTIRWDLLKQKNLFVAVLDKGAAGSEWVVVNNADTPQTLTVDGTEISVPSTGMKFVSVDEPAR